MSSNKEQLQYKEAEEDTVPAYYWNAGGGASVSRLRGISSKKSLPKIIEYLRGTILLNPTVIKEELLFFSEHYSKVPLVTGIISNLDGGISKIPFRRLDVPYVVNVIDITTSYVKLKIDFTNFFENNTGKSIKYSFRVYNLDLIDT